MKGLISRYSSILFLFLLACSGRPGQADVREAELPVRQDDTLPEGVRRLMRAYPSFIAGGSMDSLFWHDGTSMVYDDGTAGKSLTDLLGNPDIEDQFHFVYHPVALSDGPPEKNHDPGRVRHEPFFKKMYGSTAAEVRKNLVEITWCPKLSGQKIMVTTVNGVADKLESISAELDLHPEWAKYIRNIGGTFNWRKVNGTSRMSAHSFGMTIDLNAAFSDYWQWDCRCTDEDAPLRYKNRIPAGIVAVFEKHGFIWGGAWYHYDTMHFEYRPELL